MSNTARTPLKLAASPAARIEQLVEVLDELIEVVIEENEWLAFGMPASRSKQITRKVELSELLKQWTDEIRAEKVSIRTSDERLHSMLKDRMDLLKVEMEENIVRLKAAIEASRRRVEMIMTAIRDQVKNSAPYSAGARAAGPATITLGTNVCA